ncbi:MAG TPA: ABC transporter permease [Candidatus Dormibacteraeota bacterium]|jgi:simple sugar transport system permease protein
MNTSQLIAVSIAAALVSGTPILWAAVGELFAEKVGVFNVGIEGVMLMGAVSAFVVAFNTDNALLGLVAGFVVGVLFIALFAFVTCILGADQLVCGIALVLIGIGASNQIGQPYVTQISQATIAAWHVPFLSEIPFVGRAVFQEPWLVYLSWIVVAGAHFLFKYTRHGMNLRAIGEDPDSAEAAGIPVVRWRILYVLFSGGLIGLGGAFITLGDVGQWNDLVTGGAGWIALAVVIVSNWRPLPIVAIAYLFGAMRILGSVGQSLGWPIPSDVLSALPFLATLLFLVVQVWRYRRTPGFNAGPAALGQVFAR